MVHFQEKLKSFLSTHVYLVLIALLAIVSLTWFKSDFIFNGDFSYFDVGQSFYKNIFRWDAFGGSGFPSYQSVLFYFGFLIPFKLLGYLISFSTSEKIMFYVWVLSAGWGAYNLCRVMGLEKKAGFFAGCLYIFNTYSMIYIFHFGSGVVTFGYVFLPAILALLFRGYKKKRGLVYAVGVNLLILFGFGTSYVNPVYIVTISVAVFLYFLYMFLFVGNDRGSRQSYVKISAYYLLVFILFNLFWLVPFLLESRAIVQNIVLYEKDTSAIAKVIRTSYSPEGLLNLLGFWALHEAFKGVPYYIFGNYYLNPLILVISYLLPLLIFIIPVWARKKISVNQGIWFWYVLTILCLLAIGGAKIPGFSVIFLKLLAKVSFVSSGFRNIATKIGPLLMLGYAVLFGFSVSYLTNEIRNKIIRKSLAVVFFVLFIIVLPLPLWLGQQFRDINGYFPSAHIKIPNYYQDLRRELDLQKLDYRLSTLPTIKYDGTTLRWDYGYDAANFYGAIFNKPILSSNNDQPYLLALKAAKLINDGDWSDTSLKLLSFYGVKYSIFFTDTDWAVVAGNNEVIPESRALIEQYYTANSDRTTKKEFGKLQLFTINTRYFLPHFYIPKNIIVSDTNSLDGFPEIVSQPDYQIRSAIYWQNPGLPTIITNPPVVEFKKINPVKYRIRIHGADAPFPLIFGETYHRDWKIYLNSRFEKAEEYNINRYELLPGNERDQANSAELAQFIGRGWVTDLGQKQKMEFVSKNFQDTIQMV